MGKRDTQEWRAAKRERVLPPSSRCNLQSQPLGLPKLALLYAAAETLRSTCRRDVILDFRPCGRRSFISPEKKRLDSYLREIQGEWFGQQRADGLSRSTSVSDAEGRRRSLSSLAKTTSESREMFVSRASR